MNVGEVIDREYWNNEDGAAVLYTAQKEPVVSHYENFTKSKVTRENDLLLARNATPYIYLPKVGSIYTDHVIRAHISKNYDRRFIRYSLRVAAEHIIGNTVTIPTYSISLWGNRIIVYPSLQEQNEIANYLDKHCQSIDIACQNIEQEIETLQMYKQSLTYEYVTGKKRII